jgi:hypothetical protein
VRLFTRLQRLLVSLSRSVAVQIVRIARHVIALIAGVSLIANVLVVVHIAAMLVAVSALDRLIIMTVAIVLQWLIFRLHPYAPR